MATKMKSRLAKIHLTKELATPPALGDSFATAFSVLIIQRKSVNSIATLPGMASGGMR